MARNLGPASTPATWPSRRLSKTPLLILLGAIAAGLAFLVPTSAARPGGAAAVDFGQSIRPLFEKHCFECHGPRKQESGLRLDVRSSAMTGGDSGRVIVPGDAPSSRLYQLITSTDPRNRMPHDGKPLPKSSIDLIEQWISQGAQWPDHLAGSLKIESDHWAFKPPVKAPLPQVRDVAWPLNPVDYFILQKIEAAGLKPNNPASRQKLIRRLYLDLIGIPPTIAQIDAFLADPSPEAYEKVVDQLLASPHYGERWARHWMDIARYADTNGYEKDRPRSIWPYRDWVIAAFNANMPFDAFTIDQIAGDMLPNATLAQRIATGFHRNTMINEEGGIDVEEFRYQAIVDRVNTTATAYLGLTLACAQCHTHKYDPITQREYWRFFALFNNVDEPEIAVPDPAIEARRVKILQQITALEDSLESAFPAQGPLVWRTLKPARFSASAAAKLRKLDDESLLASGPITAGENYQVAFGFSEPLSSVTAIQIQTLTHDSLPKGGPGRAANGNFVLTEIQIALKPASGGPEKKLPIARAEADFSQKQYDAAFLIDSNPATGWAIDDLSGRMNRPRTATLHLAQPIDLAAGDELVVTLRQAADPRHALGRFRIAAGHPAPAADRADQSPAARIAKAQAAWEQERRPAGRNWSTPVPVSIRSTIATTFTPQPDGSILVSGDNPNNNIYEVTLQTPLKKITAVRLDALPHESLPDGGPGRAPLFSVGDFMLTHFSVQAAPIGADGKAGAPKSVKIASAAHTYAQGGRSAAATIDDRDDTGWAVQGGIGREHSAIFVFESPVESGPSGTQITFKLEQQYIHQLTLGRFRLSITADDAKPSAALSGLPLEIERILMKPAAQRDPAESNALKRHFLSTTPLLKPIQDRIAALKASLPNHPTTMVMVERESAHKRQTRIHHRGEFTKPTVPVATGVPAILPPLGVENGPEPTRLDLARWLVDGRNPLTARVVVNSYWLQLFGRGIVETVEDFGVKGAAPTHPELLDWLAIRFVESGWDIKLMHRLIVTSAAYRQDSAISPQGLEHDPRNELMTRAPRYRLDAEILRDVSLTASGLLTHRIGGPSVFPPQPAGIASLSFGPMDWRTSTGPQRYRRGLYTYAKRTSFYPAFTTLDAPLPDACVVRRSRSNTPLAALTTLNDLNFLEAARALAYRVVIEGGPDEAGRIALMFRLATGRLPDDAETGWLAAFVDQRRTAYAKTPKEAAELAAWPGVPAPAGLQQPDLAAWVALARALLNLDESISRE